MAYSRSCADVLQLHINPDSRNAVELAPCPMHNQIAIFAERLDGVGEREDGQADLRGGLRRSAADPKLLEQTCNQMLFGLCSPIGQPLARNGPNQVVQTVLRASPIR